MSGHSKWHSIKHKKGATRRQARAHVHQGHQGNHDCGAHRRRRSRGNPRLRKAICDAKELNMPADNIKRAIMKGTGELEGGQLEELTYEGYGPGGVAMIVEVVTDNRNRTVSEIRHVFSKNGGNMGEAGSVALDVQQERSTSSSKSPRPTKTRLMTLAIDAGADDFTSEEIELRDLHAAGIVRRGVERQSKRRASRPSSAEISMIPQNYSQGRRQDRSAGRQADGSSRRSRRRPARLRQLRYRRIGTGRSGFVSNDAGSRHRLRIPNHRLRRHRHRWRRLCFRPMRRDPVQAFRPTRPALEIHPRRNCRRHSRSSTRRRRIRKPVLRDQCSERSETRTRSRRFDVRRGSKPIFRCSNTRPWK